MTPDGTFEAPRAAPAEQAPASRRDGGRLAAAFHALETFPALGASQERLRAALLADPVDRRAITDLAEADLGIGIAVLRSAARIGRGTSVVAAVQSLDRSTLGVLVESLSTVDLLDPPGPWERAAVAHRSHVLGVQSALTRIALLVDDLPTDLLHTAALLHDVGKLVLLRVHPGPGVPVDQRAPAHERLAAERRTFGVDHPTVGGVLVRRWRLPAALGRLVERHHEPDDGVAPAALRLAGLLAHHAAGDEIELRSLAEAAGHLDLPRDAVRALLHDQAEPAPPRPCATAVSPLSRREVDVLELLAQGLPCSSIAAALHISVGTTRSHLHRLYGKLDVADRAQAVLLASARGWIDVRPSYGARALDPLAGQRRAV